MDDALEPDANPPAAVLDGPAWVLVRTDDDPRSNGQPIYFHQLVGGEWLPVVAARPQQHVQLGMPGRVSYYLLDDPRLDPARRARLVEDLAGMFRRDIAYAEEFLGMGFLIPADRVAEVGPEPARALLTPPTIPPE